MSCAAETVAPAHLENLVVAGHTLATSAVNVGEIYSGLRIGEESRTEALLSRLSCFPSLSKQLGTPARSGVASRELEEQ